MRTKIFVISLDDAVSRRVQIERDLNGSALDWTFFDAHRTLRGNLSYCERDSCVAHGRVLRQGELGCYSSHYHAWQWLVDSEYAQMLVVEDDVAADWSFVEYLTTLNLAAMGIDYLRLFAKIPPRWRYVASPFFDRYHHLIRCTSYALGTQAYVLTKKGAARLLAAGGRVRFPVDALLDRYWEHGLTNLALYPFPAYERLQASSIGSARFADGTLPLAQSWQFRARRLCDRARMLWAYYGPERAALRKLRRDLRGCFVAEQAISGATPLALGRR